MRTKFGCCSQTDHMAAGRRQHATPCSVHQHSRCLCPIDRIIRKCIRTSHLCLLPWTHPLPFVPCFLHLATVLVLTPLAVLLSHVYQPSGHRCGFHNWIIPRGRDSFGTWMSLPSLPSCRMDTLNSATNIRTKEQNTFERMHRTLHTTTTASSKIECVKPQSGAGNIGYSANEKNPTTFIIVRNQTKQRLPPQRLLPKGNREIVPASTSKEEHNSPPLA